MKKTLIVGVGEQAQVIADIIPVNYLDEWPSLNMEILVCILPLTNSILY